MAAPGGHVFDFWKRGVALAVRARKTKREKTKNEPELASSNSRKIISSAEKKKKTRGRKKFKNHFLVKNSLFSFFFRFPSYLPTMSALASSRVSAVRPVAAVRQSQSQRVSSIVLFFF